MKMADFNGKQYTMQDNGDGSITLVPVQVKAADGDWVPTEGDLHYYVSYCGTVDVAHHGVNGSLRFHNIFPTEAQAKKAAEYMRRSNAIIRACLLVDPDFVPDWDNSDQNKHTVFYHHMGGVWKTDVFQTCQSCAGAVSTKEKADQVCALLTKWGVK